MDIVLVCLYSLCILPSVLMSEQLEASALKYFSFLSYWIAIIFPLYIFKRDILSIWYSSIIFGLISATYVIGSSLIESGLGLRLQVIGDVDGNHLSIGLGVLVILTLRTILNSRGRVLCIVLWLAVLLLLSSIFLLMSRTVLVGLFGGGILAFLVGILTQLRQRDLKLLIAIFFVTILFFIFFAEYSSNSLDYLDRRFVEFRFNESRLTLWQESLKSISAFSDWRAVFWGMGYFQSNPHNEFLRYLSDSGVFGLFWLLLFLALFYWSKVWSLRKNRIAFAFQNWMFLYLLTYLCTYGHVKTFWVAPVGIVLNCMLTRQLIGR